MPHTTITMPRYRLSARSFGSIVSASRGLRSPSVFHDEEGGKTYGRYLRRYTEDAYALLERKLIELRNWHTPLTEDEEDHLRFLFHSTLEARKLWFAEYGSRALRNKK